MRERIEANVSRLSAMNVRETITVDRATVERWSKDRWGITVGEHLTAHTLNRAALFLSALEEPPRLVELVLDVRAFARLPGEAKARASELKWHRRETTAQFVSGILTPAQAATWREKLVGIALEEEDLTDHFVLGVTNAPADYDGFLTTEIERLGDDRLVAMMKEHARSWQIPRYASGNKVCEIVD